MDFKGPTRRNNKCFVVRKLLDWRDGDIVDLLTSIEVNDGFVVLFKGGEQDPDLWVKIVHPSIDDESEATESETEENNDDNAPKTPYDDENRNAFYDGEGNNDEDAPETPYDGENSKVYSNNEGNNYKVSPKPLTNDVNINSNSDDEINYYEVTPYTPTNV